MPSLKPAGKEHGVSATKEHPILFTAPMVRAILAGRKTQTRRVLKPQPRSDTTGFRTGLENEHDRWWPTNGGDYTGPSIRCPYGEPGDRLWVRETWAACGKDVRYRADQDHPDDYPGAHFQPRVARCSTVTTPTDTLLTEYRHEHH